MIVIAARDAPAADRNAADVVCDGKTDVAVLAKAMAEPDREIVLTAGTFNGNGGFNAAGNRYLSPAAGLTVRGAGPGLTRIVAENEPCRIAVDAPGVTLANIGGFGYIGIQDTADGFTCEDVYVTHAINGAYVAFGRKGGCTAAFMVWGRKGRTVQDLTFRRCSVERSYHHAFSLNLAGANEGGGFADVLFDQCHAICAGSGMERWSCGFDIPDAGDIERMTVRDCQAVDCWQDGFHLDGSWDGHRQRAMDVLFERCRASMCGWRSGTAPGELYQSGFYVQSARLVDCEAERCRKAGFLCKNEESSGLVLEGCRDTGSAYSLVIEYGGNGAKVEGFISEGATRRALQMVGNDASVEIEIRNFAGNDRPVLLGVTERLEFVDAPAHAADLARYRARGYAMKGNRIRIVTDRPMEAVEVHPPSVNSVEMTGLTVVCNRRCR
ncbi:MAG: right-handed parallel beta-helix repeat-containing protein [Methanospirillum sp.]